MKKFLSLLALCTLVGVFTINAQNPRMVVVECFTSATCGPCASINPSLDNLMENNEDISLYIKYHVNWPSDHDPMNHHNPANAKSKVSYYGIGYVPMSVVDGVVIGNSSNINQQVLNQNAAVASPVEMRMTHWLNNTNDTIYVMVMGRATSAIESEDLRLNVGVIEKVMEYSSAPGTNGERIFHNVMKKMLPVAGGQPVPSLNAGDYFAYKFSWALANVMDNNQLSAVAWLQDNSDKTIFQGCKSQENLNAFFAKNCMISDVQHSKKFVCNGSMSPYVVVDNFGSETIANLTLKVKINGSEVKTVNWNGNVQTGSSAKVQLGDIDFEAVANNTLEIEVVEINGAPDDYKNALVEMEFEDAEVVVAKTFKLTLRTDNNPQETTWDVVDNGTGIVVVSGGPYSEPNKTINETFELSNDGCYTFTIYDAGGDGMSSGNGLYGLKAGNKTLFSGKDFYDKESNDFYYENVAEVTEIQANTINVFPNPSSGSVTVTAEGSVFVSIYNISGQNLYNQAIEGVTTLDISNLGTGTFMFVMTNADGESARQIVVLK